MNYQNKKYPKLTTNVFRNIVFFICFFCIPATILSQSKEIDSLVKELKIHKKNDTIRVNLLNELSECYIGIDNKKSYQKAQEAIALAKKLNFKKGEAYSLLRFSDYKSNISELNSAIEYGFEALQICEEIKDEDCVYATNILLGKIFTLKYEYESAKKYTNKAYEYSLKTDNLNGQANILSNLGAISYHEGNLDEALNIFKKAQKIRAQLGDEKSSLSILNNIAVINLNQGRYTEALEYFNEYLKINKKNNNKDGIASAYYNISAVYYELKDYNKTLSYLNQALPFFRELNDKRMIAGTLINLGAVYSDLKEFPKALEYMTESMVISYEINDEKEISSGNFQLGDLYLNMNQPEKALKHYNTCLELSLAIEDQLYICQGEIGLARSHALLYNYPKALTHALTGKKIADELELLAQQKLVTGLLSEIYYKTGQYKKAFETHQEFKKLNDSIFNKESIEKITQLEYEYKYKQALDSASIKELKLTKTVFDTSKDLEKSQRNLFLGIITFLAVAMVLGSIIFYLRLRHSKAKTEHIITEQKLLRTQMTPHFIFNSLSVLQGMILNKEESKSVGYLSKFSKLLRITLENSRDKTVLLSQELEAIDNYLSLQNIENEKINFKLSVDDAIETNTIQVPPMLIQPFVENAIEHAFIIKKEDCRIEINLSLIDSKLICIILDNGIGIDSSKRHTNQNKKSLATTITSERLQYLSKDFKMQGSIMIEDRSKFNEQGTKVTIQIPYK